ncbi:hypothetical protein [uncultured Mediterranean phage uvMED]|nr:hypothetical protein [uncultured Mediterranean phage uvMED]
MSTKVEAPPPRNYGQETRDTLQAQVDLADDLLSAEKRTRPEYADLERRMMLEQLGIDPNIGLLDAYENYIAPSQVRQRRQAVEGDIAMVRDLGKDLIEAQREADPLAESLRQKVMTGSGDMADRMEGELDGEFIEGLRDEMSGGLVGQLREEYESEGGLTEQEKRDLDQQVLGMAQERGAVGQNMTDFNRLRERLTGDRRIRQQRLQNYMGAKQQALGNFMGARQQGLSNYATALQNVSASYKLGAQDPLFALTGRASRVPGDVTGQFNSAGFALDSSPAIFNPESQYAGQLATQNYQGIMDARTATASNRAGLMSGAMGFAGNVLGGMATGGTGFFKS